jgi:hypothetical protein
MAAMAGTRIVTRRIAFDLYIVNGGVTGQAKLLQHEYASVSLSPEI